MAWDVGDIIAAINLAENQINEEAIIGLELAAEFVGQKSDTVVPLDEGPLQNSRKVVIQGTRAAISYNTPYAQKQHEDLSLSHPGGRKAKYLEGALNGSGPQVAQIVEARIRRAF